MKQPDPSLKNEQGEKGVKNTCAEDENPLTLNSKSLRFLLMGIRHSLVTALKFCDRLLAALKTK
jgi:hypothetical protein